MNTDLVAAALKVQRRSVKRTTEAIDAALAGDASVASLQSILNAVNEEHKQLHARLTRLVKALHASEEDPGVEGVCPATLLESPAERDGLCSAIADGLTRRGAARAARVVLDESGAAEPCLRGGHTTDAQAGQVVPLSAAFQQIHAEATQLRDGDVSRALQWTKAHARSLVANALNPEGLEFKLHAVRFLQLLSGRVWREGAGAVVALALPLASRIPLAMAYSRHTLPPFARRFGGEVSGLVGVALQMQAGQPFPSAVDAEYRAAAAKEFVHARCALARVSDAGPLDAVLAAGMSSFPHVLRASRLVLPRAGTSVLAPGVELPIEPPVAQYHSVFSDPVSRQQAQPSDNPPMLLTCGHVVSKDTLSRLSSQRPRFKCPTCPQVQSSSTAMELHIEWPPSQ